MIKTLTSIIFLIATTSLSEQIHFENYLDFAILCQNIIGQEFDSFIKFIFIKHISKYLEAPPFGKNLAICNQINRKTLLCYCQNYEFGQIINFQVFYLGLKYACTKLAEKQALFNMLKLK